MSTSGFLLEVEGDAAGTYALGPEAFQVGTSRRCQLQLRGHGISFVHAILAPAEGAADEGAWTVTAKASSAGTHVNGEALKSGETRRLAPGDRLAFGPVEARFVVGEAPAAATRPEAGAGATAAPAAPTPGSGASGAQDAGREVAPAPAGDGAPALSGPDDATTPRGLPARFEAPPAEPPPRVAPSADDGAEALAARLEAAEGERDALRALVDEAQAEAEGARCALATLTARLTALEAERDALCRKTATLEADVRLARASAAPSA